MNENDREYSWSSMMDNKTFRNKFSVVGAVLFFAVSYFHEVLFIISWKKSEEILRIKYILIIISNFQLEKSSFDSHKKLFNAFNIF